MLKCPKCKHVWEPYSYDIPNWLDQSAWDRWLKHRDSMDSKLKKNPVRMAVIKRRAISKLEGYKNEGYDIVSIIDNSIDCGWISLFPSGEERERMVNKRELRASKLKEQELPRKTAPDVLEKIALLLKQQFDIARKLSSASLLQKLSLKTRLHEIEAEIKELNSGVVRLGDVK